MVVLRFDYNFVKWMMDMVYFWWVLFKYKFRLCLYNVNVVYFNFKVVNVVIKIINVGNYFRNFDL